MSFLIPAPVTRGFFMRVRTRLYLIIVFIVAILNNIILPSRDKPFCRQSAFFTVKIYRFEFLKKFF